MPKKPIPTPEGVPREWANRAQWERVEWYFLDWDETNGEQYNLILVPGHLYDHLHSVDEQTAASHGWKVPLEDGYYYRNRYDGVRNTINHMLQPYGTYEDYQATFGYPGRVKGESTLPTFKEFLKK